MTTLRAPSLTNAQTSSDQAPRHDAVWIRFLLGSVPQISGKLGGEPDRDRPAR
jgi:hypothetical protein